MVKSIVVKPSDLEIRLTLTITRMIQNISIKFNRRRLPTDGFGLSVSHESFKVEKM